MHLARNLDVPKISGLLALRVSTNTRSRGANLGNDVLEDCLVDNVVKVCIAPRDIAPVRSKVRTDETHGRVVKPKSDGRTALVSNHT